MLPIAKMRSDASSAELPSELRTCFSPLVLAARELVDTGYLTACHFGSLS